MQLDKIEKIDGNLLRELISSGIVCLYAHKAEVDALNVFPVPDGDTGTNMYLTFQGAMREINKNSKTRIDDVLESAAYGALMGARGNSGVIVSQFFRGFVKGLPKGLEKLTKTELALGFNSASNLCYQAVRQPVEGTILTIIKEIARFATENAEKKSTIAEFLKEIYRHANQVLARTPEMLPILKQAGVVDAGGQGMVYFFQGMIRYLNGESLEAALPETLEPSKNISLTPYTDELLPDSAINFQYCTEFILKGTQSPLDHEYIKNSLSPHGDCLLVVGDENTAKIHIHTNNPGIMLDFAVRLGDMFEIQINNMIEQSRQRLSKNIAVESSNRQFAIVAVAAGDGLERIFRSLGVQSVVNGGQTMNPNIEELVKAVSLLQAPQVIILPNNNNIVMTANHVQELVTKKVGVVPTSSIPEGLASLMCFSEERSLEENLEKMSETGKKVITGEITYATRSIKIRSMAIQKGDIIGLINGEIAAAGKTPEEVLQETLGKIPNTAQSLVSIYYGEDVTAITAQDLLNNLEKIFPRAEFELYYGGQPLYYYLFSVE